LKTSRIRIITFFILFLIISLNFSTFVLAKQRKTYLTDFLLDCEVKDKGFSNSPQEEDDISYESTAYAIEILNDYQLLEKRDIFGEIEHTVNTSDLQEYLEDKGKDKINEAEINIYNIYYILKALNIMDYDTSSSLESNVKHYLNSLNLNGSGFAPKPSSVSGSLSSTYFAMMIYEIIEDPIPYEKSHKNWIRSCINSNGGYGGNTTLPSTILDTFYAILIFEQIYDIEDLPSEDNTIEYLKSFYVDEESDEDNYGGYLPDDKAENALISSTYYCVKGISLIDKSELKDEDETLNWILNRQDAKDGGFTDNSDGDEQKESSVTVSYFAYQALIVLDGEELPSLEQKVFMLEFIWVDWLIFVVILSSLGVAVIVGYIRWRKRRI